MATEPARLNKKNAVHLIAYLNFVNDDTDILLLLLLITYNQTRKGLIKNSHRAPARYIVVNVRAFSKEKKLL